MPSSVYDIFKKYPKLDDYLAVKNGMSTTDNNRFLRFWYEVELNGSDTIIGYDLDGPKQLILYPEVPKED
jgi:hypothetical protein